MKMIDAGEFERDVQRILEEVQATGEPVTITGQGGSVTLVKTGEMQEAEGLSPVFGLLKNDRYSFPDPFSPTDDLWEEAFIRKWDEKLL